MASVLSIICWGKRGYLEYSPIVLLCSGDDPLNDAWIEKGMIQKAVDGDDPYSFIGFSIDATVFEHRNKRYLLLL